MVVVVTVVVVEAVEGGKESGDWECLRWGMTPPTLDTITGKEEGAVQCNRENISPIMGLYFCISNTHYKVF